MFFIDKFSKHIIRHQRTDLKRQKKTKGVDK